MGDLGVESPSKKMQLQIAAATWRNGNIQTRSCVDLRAIVMALSGPFLNLTPANFFFKNFVTKHEVKVFTLRKFRATFRL